MIYYFAMATMFADHFALFLLEPGGFWYDVLRNIGRAAMPLYVWIFVHSLHFTTDLARYGQRVSLLAVFAALPHYLVVGELNILFMFAFVIAFMLEKRVLWFYPVLFFVVEYSVIVPVLVILFIASGNGRASLLYLQQERPPRLLWLLFYPVHLWVLFSFSVLIHRGF